MTASYVQPPHTKTVRRVARRNVRCGWGTCRTIPAGEVYLLHTEFPGGESGYADAAGKPVQMAECHDCAHISVVREHLLLPDGLEPWDGTP